ncbi:hypothetical protein QN277_014354 [Acacia crassicarpa]|uniref:Endonuclease/exonuclease/phosphatase domain-containing protein n=1 Tax=Acacia crassicarpa TaxID=499986 RepID=A0AAE1ILY4_9FABA|nr:hypothetical protein QN277_014354 [Acacia crassicarpa]
MVKKFHPSIIFLMETKINSVKGKRIMWKCGFNCDLFVEPCGLAGGLAVWWKDDMSVSVLYKSKNIVHTVIEARNCHVPKYVTFVYGPPKERERRAVWDILRSLALNVKESWLVVGDFNDILSQAEKERGNPRAMRKIINFQSLLSDCNLLDLEFKGSKYTWCNKRPGATVRERLDRALGNVEFREEFEKAMVFHVEPIGSDHHGLVVDYCFIDGKTPRAFRFEANWVAHRDFCEVVKKAWNEVEEVLEDKLRELCARLEACRKRLVAWSRREFPNFRKVIDLLRCELRNCHSGILTAEKLQQAENLIKHIDEAWDNEERYWWQRSRITWLKCGDRNSKFFHNSVIQRRQRNKILRLKNEQGCWLEEKEDINRLFCEFYRGLFKSGGSRPLEETLAYVPCVVTVEDNENLMQPVTNSEIEEAVFQLGSNKAPGPDGFSALFYQASWKEVSKEVVTWFIISLRATEGSMR